MENGTATRIDLAGKTRNLRHRTLVSKMCQYLKEAVGAGSGNEPQIDKHDFGRMKEYIADCEEIIKSLPIAGAVLAKADDTRPEVDTPLTRDDWWQCDPPINVPKMENAFWEEACLRWRKAIREVSNAQSALYSNHWHPSDKPRWLQYLTAARHDMEVVIGKIEPIDQPLTRPSAQPVFEKIEGVIDTAGASNAPGHPYSS